MITKVCEQCRREFQARLNRHRFCGRKCAAIVNRAKYAASLPARPLKTCDGCGAQFTPKESRSTDARPQQRFCSQTCYWQTETRTHQFNQSYFDVIDTAEKAYWLGFITGDGSIASRGLQISLMRSDAGHLDKLRDALGYEGPLHFGASRSFGGEHPCARLHVSSVHIRDALMAQGILPRKSLKEVAWTGPPHLRRHWWRGLIDADGTIRPDMLLLCGSQACMEAFARYISDNLGLYVGVRQPNGRKVWVATLSGRMHARQGVALLYEGASVFLDRKMALAKAVLDLSPESLRIWTPEQRAKLRASKQGWASPRSIAAAHTPEANAKRTATRKARGNYGRSAESRARQATTLRAYYAAKRLRAQLPPPEP